MNIHVTTLIFDSDYSQCDGRTQQSKPKTVTHNFDLNCLKSLKIKTVLNMFMSCRDGTYHSEGGVCNKFLSSIYEHEVD